MPTVTVPVIVRGGSFSYKCDLCHALYRVKPVSLIVDGAFNAVPSNPI